MKKLNILILIAAVVVFAAGALVGMVGQRAVAKTSEISVAPLPHGKSQLISELSLTAPQQDKIRTIWSQAVVKAGPPQTDKYRALGDEREQSILALLNDSQKARYTQVVEEYRQKSDAMHQASRAVFADAEEQTKAILDPTQKAKYEDLLKRRPRRRSATAPTTQTAVPLTARKTD